MRVFTKTCARDAKRAFYQHHALMRVGAIAQPTDHVILIEGAELDRVRTLSRALPAGVVREVESEMPEAMRIPNPYVRQQFCKLLAPTLYGNVLELDSDMCPRYEPPPDLAAYVWYYTSNIPKAHDSLLAEWQRLWRAWTGKMPIARSYMFEQRGWFMRTSLTHSFLRWLDDLGGAHSSERRHPGAVRLFESLSGGWLRFSEYQFFGWFADTVSELGDYSFVDAARTKPPPSMKDWVLHATSAEPLTPQLEDELSRLAGGVRWPG